MLKSCIPIICLGFIGACDLLTSPDAPIRDKVVSANEGLGTLVETARLGAYSDKATFGDTAPSYGKIISNLKSAAVELKPTKPSQKPREDLIDVINACVDRVTALSQVHKRFGLKPDRAFEIFTSDCTLADIAIKEEI